MTEDRSTEGTVSQELRQLGRNLTELLRAAWDSPERKAIQGEIANGLSQLGDVLKEESQKFSQTQAGQRVKDTAQDVRERIRSRDEQVRQDLVNALHGANTRLRQTVENMSKSGVPGTGTSGQAETPTNVAPPRETGHEEVHPDDVDQYQ